MTETFSREALKHDTKDALARNLYLARKAAGMKTQDALATKAGMSLSQINQIERGEADPRISSIAALASALGITPSLLLLGEQDIRRWRDLIEELEPELETEVKSRLSEEEFNEITWLAHSDIRKKQYEAFKKTEGDIRTAAEQRTGLMGAGVAAAVAAAIATPLMPVLGPVVAGSVAIGALLGKLVKK